MRKISARPTIDLRPILLRITELSQRLSQVAEIQKNPTLKGQIGNLLTTLTQYTKELEPVVQKDDDGKVPVLFRKNLDYGERTACMKCAKIRGNEIRECPMGLSIPRACKMVGNAIHKMVSVENMPEEQQTKYASVNKVIFAHNKESKQCPYADKILDDKFGKVDCDFGDTGAGQHDPSINGSPLYPQTFSGVGLNGLYGYPLSWYGDNSASRNMFYGLFSFVGSKKGINLLKLGIDIGRLMKIFSSESK